MGDNPSHCKGPDWPVETVSWDDTKEFIDKLNEIRKTRGDRCTYALPTEAQWEYAARGGNKISEDEMQAAFSFGNDRDKLKEYAWFEGNTRGETHDVATRKPNPLGLFDVHGNVSQWVEDKYMDDASTLPSTDPVNKAGGSRHVFRGGGWPSDSWLTRSAFRGSNKTDYRDAALGFRLVRTCPQDNGAQGLVH